VLGWRSNRPRQFVYKLTDGSYESGYLFLVGQHREVALSSRLRTIEQLARDLGRELERARDGSKIPHALADAIRTEINVVIRVLNDE